MSRSYSRYSMKSPLLPSIWSHRGTSCGSMAFNSSSRSQIPLRIVAMHSKHCAIDMAASLWSSPDPQYFWKAVEIWGTRVTAWGLMWSPTWSMMIYEASTTLSLSISVMMQNSSFWEAESSSWSSPPPHTLLSNRSWVCVPRRNVYTLRRSCLFPLPLSA